jgi:hypothetical protein
MLRTESGVRLARLRSNGGLDATVVLDRAMDIAQASFRGVPFVWHGPGGILPAHPGTMNDDGFERNFFAGLVTTCGLEAFGPSGSDENGSWTTHGHVNHLAADEVGVRVDVESEDNFIELRGVVRQNRMFGETLQLERTWRLNRCGTLLRLHDRVTNAGGEPQPHMLLYHCNAGYPLLDEHLQISLSQRSMKPRDERARKGLDVWNAGGVPQGGFEEEVFIHEPAAVVDGWAVAAFRNERLPMTWTIRFRPEQLPACITWRMLGTRTYVMAIEPANCPTIQGRIEARKRGTLPMLQPGETREYDLEFEFQ